LDDLFKALKLPSPIETFRFEDFPDQEIYIKRDDLIHPQISGNKWRKLKYNIQHVLDNNLSGIISFGGAFSNHLYALAAACKIARIKCVAYVRGSSLDLANPTLKFLIENKVDVRLIARSEYRAALQPKQLSILQSQFPDYHVIPEGGSNALAFKGVKEIMEEVYVQGMSEKMIVVAAVGSGATITGLVKGLTDDSEAFGLLAVKDSSLHESIHNQLSKQEDAKLTLDNEAHLGGFAKVNDELISFANQFYKSSKIPIDLLYNAKVLLRLKKLLRSNMLDPNKDLLVIHTGGLQGNLGFDYRFPGKLDASLVGK